MADNSFEPNRKKFWTQKYIREHIAYLIGSFVLPVIVFLFLYAGKKLQLTPLQWVLAIVLFIGLDAVYFIRHLSEYVRVNLDEEERKGLAKDGYSTLDPNDPRFVDVDEK